MKRILNKDDITQLVEGARSMVGALSEQAAAGEVDANLLNQVGAALEMAVDYVEDQAGAAMPAADEAANSQGMALSDAPVEKEEMKEPEMPSDVAGGDKPAIPPEESVSPEEKMSKATNPENEPVGVKPPQTPELHFQRSEDEMGRNLGEFVKALEFGNIQKARQLAGSSQAGFEIMVTKAAHHLMDEQGWNIKNIRNIHAGFSKADFSDPMDRMGRNRLVSGSLQKEITASDIPGINLLRLARLMLPVYAGLRRRLPAQTPETGSDQATWRAQLGFGALSFASGMRVDEAAVGQAMAEDFLTFNAPYKDSAFNDSVTLKATFASRGYDDPLQVATIVTLSALLRQEEINILGQSAAAIAAPASVTATGVASGGGLADATYTVKVTSLTYEGWLGGSNGGTDVGETTATESSGTTITGGGGLGSVEVTFPTAVGAVAYNVYLKVGAGTYAWVATVTKNSYTIIAAGTGDAPPVSNLSANSNGYEGLISWAERSTVYGNSIPQKVTPTDMEGGALTTTSNAGIDQFDTILEALWSQWQISPTGIVTSPKGGNSTTTKLLNTDNPLLYRVDLTSERGTAQGGVMVTGYVNKFAPFGDGSARVVDLISHPYCPDGTFIFMCEAIPYSMSREARGWALETLVPYTYFPLYPTSTIVYPFAVTLSETLECFHPSVQTAIQGADVGQTA